MELRIKIILDNAAFEDTQGAEIARILRAYADHVEHGALNDYDLTANLIDANGNSVGMATVAH